MTSAPVRHVVDKASGLVATVLVSPSTRKIVLAFGDTTAGEVPGEALERMKGNGDMTVPQWAANAQAGMGVEPKSYAPAVALTRRLDDLLKQGGEWQGYGLSLIARQPEGKDKEI